MAERLKNLHGIDNNRAHFNISTEVSRRWMVKRGLPGLVLAAFGALGCSPKAATDQGIIPQLVYGTPDKPLSGESEGTSFYTDTVPVSPLVAPTVEPSIPSPLPSPTSQPEKELPYKDEYNRQTEAEKRFEKRHMEKVGEVINKYVNKGLYIDGDEEIIIYSPVSWEALEENRLWKRENPNLNALTSSVHLGKLRLQMEATTIYHNSLWATSILEVDISQSSKLPSGLERLVVQRLVFGEGRKRSVLDGESLPQAVREVFSIQHDLIWEEGYRYNPEGRDWKTVEAQAFEKRNILYLYAEENGYLLFSISNPLALSPLLIA